MPLFHGRARSPFFFNCHDFGTFLYVKRREDLPKSDDSTLFMFLQRFLYTAKKVLFLVARPLRGGGRLGGHLTFQILTPLRFFFKLCCPWSYYYVSLTKKIRFYHISNDFCNIPGGGPKTRKKSNCWTLVGLPIVSFHWILLRMNPYCPPPSPLIFGVYNSPPLLYFLYNFHITGERYSSGGLRSYHLA